MKGRGIRHAMTPAGRDAQAPASNSLFDSLSIGPPKSGPNVPAPTGRTGFGPLRPSGRDEWETTTMQHQYIRLFASGNATGS
jgi:hypothetical protein